MKKLIINHPSFLLFGIFQIFFSAPGQTFLISLFVTSIFNELQLSLSLFAGLYSTATLAASLLLNPAGRFIDRFSVQTILITNAVLMSLGCLLIALAHNMVFLFLGFLLVRFIGQGVFGLTASTLFAQSFHKNRGKAMGIMTLGFPLSELIYPTLALSLLVTFGWRFSYILFASSFILIMLPLQWFLIGKSSHKKGHFLPGETLIQPQRLSGYDTARHTQAQKQYKVKEVIKDPIFYLIILSSCMPPLLMTGLLFHQEALFNAHQWPILLAATGLGAYAIAKALGSVLIGPVVDKHGPIYPFIALIAMLGLGTFVAAIGGSEWVIFLYFGLMGAALGISSPVMNVIWPNLYGTQYLGSIKGFVSTFRNGLTAFGPLPVALAMDYGIQLTDLLKYTSLFVLALAIIPYVVYKLRPSING